MRAKGFQSLPQFGDIEEARMGPSEFDAAVQQGTTKGVLVGFEFEVFVPKATIDAVKQSAQESLTSEKVSKIFYQRDIFTYEDNFSSLSPAVFDQLFKLKPGTQAKYPNAVEAYNVYRLNLLEKAKQAPVQKFILIDIIPNTIEAMEAIKNSVDKGVQLVDNQFDPVGYVLIRKNVYPPNHPITQNALKELLRKRFVKK